MDEVNAETIILHTESKLKQFQCQLIQCQKNFCSYSASKKFWPFFSWASDQTVSQCVTNFIAVWVNAKTIFYNWLSQCWDYGDIFQILTLHYNWIWLTCCVFSSPVFSSNLEILPRLYSQIFTFASRYLYCVISCNSLPF